MNRGAALEHAHGEGIVHRDLKPGNVWLTSEGTAMLGDFGLTVAADRSRLTQQGMIVGTAAYLPPELAVGGDVTPRSDLYSLGAPSSRSAFRSRTRSCRWSGGRRPVPETSLPAGIAVEKLFPGTGLREDSLANLVRTAQLPHLIGETSRITATELTHVVPHLGEALRAHAQDP